MTRRDRDKVAEVMREFKRGTLRSGSRSGPIVRNRKQAIAIALSEARRAKSRRAGRKKSKRRVRRAAYR